MAIAMITAMAAPSVYLIRSVVVANVCCVAVEVGFACSDAWNDASAEDP